MLPVPKLTAQESQKSPGHVLNVNWKVDFSEDYILPLLRLSYLPWNHYVDNMFDIIIVWWTKNLVSICIMYGEMFEQNMSGHRRGQNSQLYNMFIMVIDKNVTGISMEFYESPDMEVREHV